MSRRIRETDRRVALVTGGARRVGRAVALSLARSGWDVAITCRSSGEQARAVVGEIEQLGRRSVSIEVDLAKSDAAEVVYERFGARFDRLDALVNNAAIFSPTPLGALTAADYDRYSAVNARAPLMLIQRFASMLGAGYEPDKSGLAGRVVNLIDIAVLGQPMSKHAAYSASKAALLELTRSCALELAPAVLVNAVAPGVVAWAESFSAAEREGYLRRVPLGRAGVPDDAAEAVRWLVCDAHYCTGQVIRVDGGRLLG